MSETTVLICPKCQGAMRTYERSGVVIDQCTDCRGVFLDYGELERMIDAEGTLAGGARHDSREAGDDERDHDHSPDPIRHRREHVPGVDDDWRGRDLNGRPGGSERRRESRLGGIFDLFGGD